MKDGCCDGGYDDSGGVRALGELFIWPLAIGRKLLDEACPAGDSGADEIRPPALLAFFRAAAIVASRCSGTIRHFIPLPGSSGRRATFSKA